MTTTATLAAGVALAGALIAAAFLPSRGGAARAAGLPGAGGRLGGEGGGGREPRGPAAVFVP